MLKQLKEIVVTHYIDNAKPFTQHDLENELDRLGVTMTDAQKRNLYKSLQSCVKHLRFGKNMRTLKDWNNAPQELRDFLILKPEESSLFHLYLSNNTLFDLLDQLDIDTAHEYFPVESVLTQHFPTLDFELIQRLYEAENDYFAKYSEEELLAGEFEHIVWKTEQYLEQFTKREVLACYLLHDPRFSYLLLENEIYWYCN